MAGAAGAAWHALESEAVLESLNTTPQGLAPSEAQARLAAYGANALPEEAGPGRVTLIARQFTGPIELVLLVATGLTVLLGEFVDSAVILGVLVLNAIIGYGQERKAERSIQALTRLVAPRARVVREGRESIIDSTTVVPGDVVLLESGVRVPADLRLLSSALLALDESLLTGESRVVAKHPEPLPGDAPVADRRNMAFAGTIVTTGRGRGVAVATGAGTVVGGIAGIMRSEQRQPTPLQRRMSGFARIVGGGVGVLATVTFIIGVTRGETVSEMFRVAVAMAVSAVPEGLPVAFTITLALGVRRMASRNAIIRNLPAVETLGSTTIIGSDKTGTLTENRMEVRQIWTADESVELDGNEVRPRGIAARQALVTGVLANEADVVKTESGFEHLGDPTEVALLLAAERCGIDFREARAVSRIHLEIPFEPANQYSGAVRTESDHLVLYVKGAPERVLEMCDRQRTSAGDARLSRDSILSAAEEMADQGLRVLAMAQGPAPDLRAAEEGTVRPAGLVFLGLLGMMDPPRDGVRGAIDACRRAGIRVLMITGDHAATALSIGRMLGIGRADVRVVTGSQLDEIDEATLASVVRQTDIYARMTPAQKLRVVHALQAEGQVVAVTGDGVNDAPALKAADIGIAMGRSGTDVAREAADMVLADDNFVSIYAAVEEGRVTFANIRKVTFFLVSTGVAELIAIITALVAGWPLPFLAAQILWLNLVTNGLQDVALAFEPGDPDILERPPRPPGEGLLSRMLWERALLAGCVMAAGTLLLFRWELDRGSSEAVARTTALTTMVMLQAFHVGNSRGERQSAFTRSLVSNRFLFACSAAALGVHIAAVYLPFTQYLLKFEPVSAAAWMRIIPVAFTVVLVVEAHKLFVRLRQGQEPSLGPG